MNVQPNFPSNQIQTPWQPSAKLLSNQMQKAKSKVILILELSFFKRMCMPTSQEAKTKTPCTGTFRISFCGCQGNYLTTKTNNPGTSHLQLPCALLLLFTIEFADDPSKFQHRLRDYSLLNSLMTLRSFNTGSEIIHH